MLYYLHLLFLGPVYSLASSLLFRDQDHQILLLRQQLLIRQVLGGLINDYYREAA